MKSGCGGAAAAWNVGSLAAAAWDLGSVAATAWNVGSLAAAAWNVGSLAAAAWNSATARYRRGLRGSGPSLALVGPGGRLDAR